MTPSQIASSTALIAGGSAGIGYALAEALAQRGAKVALLGSDPARAQAAAARLSAAGHRAVGLSLDVADRGGWPAAVAQVERVLGPIAILVLNAGAQGGRNRIEDITPAEWDWVWSVNVGGLYNGLATCLPGMRARGAPGHVLITASIASLIPRATVSAYGASKAAALAIAQTVRLELEGSAIGISVLCPGLVRTSMPETMRRHAPGATEDTFDYMTAIIDDGRDPAAIAEATLEAVIRGDFYVFTHPELDDAALAASREIEMAMRPAG